MLARQLEAQHSPACNDNGQFAPRRSAAPPHLLKVAAELSGSISVSYVADGVVMISSGREHAERTSGIAGEPPRLATPQADGL